MAECRQTLLSFGWLAQKPGAFQSALLDEARLRHYEPGQYTHHIGDGLGGFYGIVRGSFAGLGPTPDAGIAMGHIFRRGDWVGEGPMVSRQPRTLSFRAMEPAAVLYVSLAAVDRICRRLPEAALHFGSLSEYNLDIAVRCMADLLIRRADRRTAAVLLRVAGTGPCEDAPETCRLTQNDLAEMANASRHIVNETLKKLEALGCIEVGYGRITVLRPQGLRAYVTGTEG